MVISKTPPSDPGLGTLGTVTPGPLVAPPPVVGAAVVTGVGGGVAGGATVVGVSSSGSTQVASHSAPSPPLLLLFDRKSTLRVRPATVTSGELSSQNFSFPIFKK